MELVLEKHDDVLEDFDFILRSFDDMLEWMKRMVDAIFEACEHHRCVAMDSLCEARQFFGWALEYESKGLMEASAVLVAEGWQAFRKYESCCNGSICHYCGVQRRVPLLVGPM